MNSIFADKRILITGGTGSWGTELVNQLLKKHRPAFICIYSRGEHKQVEMKRKFPNEKSLHYMIGDVRDKNRLMLASKNIDYIFHLAALKHVPVCEENPWEAVLTNIIGTQNVIEAAIANEVYKVVDVSTDKAVDPLNLYGITKACGEKLMISANLLDTKTRFVCVRGGNVLGTNGSVIPLFIEQLKKLNEITITDLRMTRFLMRVEDAIKLVLTAANEAIGGEVFVMKMDACKVSDLADVMIKKLGNAATKKRVIGVRPGEKITEVLVSRFEKDNTLEIDNYYVILPQLKMPRVIQQYKDHQKKTFKDADYNSANTNILTKDQIERLLEKDGWFGTSNPDPDLSRLKKTELMHIFKIEGWKE